MLDPCLIFDPGPAPFGSAVLAGYTIALRVLVFAILPGWGLANAAATLVGQNLGVGDGLMARFTDDPRVLSEGANCLRIIAYGCVFYDWGMVMVQAFNGSGHTGVPLAVNLVCFWLIKLPLAYALAVPLGLGPRGVWTAVTLAYTLSAIVGVLLFRRGGWRVPIG